MSNIFKFISVAQKSFSTSSSYAVVTLCHEPVNALHVGLWTELLQALEILESQKSPSIRGLIIASGVEKDIFTAGNDLRQLYAPLTSKQAYRKFWLTQTQFLTRLYRSPLVTIAAIRGHAPAGGCGIALCCDYRIMTATAVTPSARIGLNETAIGIIVPKYWGQLLSNTIGSIGVAEKMIFFGKMLKSEEAKIVGLIDEVTSDKHRIIEIAETRLQQLLKIPDGGRQLTKKMFRESFSKTWEAYGEEEAEHGWSVLSQPHIVGALGAVMKQLGSGSKSKL